MEPKELTDVIQKIHCDVDEDFIRKLYGEHHHNSYLKEKWADFQSNWSRWFCSLDENHQNKFLNMLYK